MSVPPLVCSTPPPPDQVEEEGYNDEFTYNYVDLSPTHQFEAREYPPYDTPSPRDKVDDTLYVSSSNVNITFQQDTTSNQPISPSISLNDNTTETIPNEMDISSCSEDCNVEDLDLKLDSLHLDFENERVTVEESLNSTFDDFGIFLSNADFIPKLENTFSESDKESKSHGTCSEESTSLHNEDWDNISQNSFNTNLNTITDQDDVHFVQKDNNDNIPKDVLTLNSPDDNEDDINNSCINKEESLDSGFKSSVNNSSDQIHSIKPDQLDSKSDIDVSVTDTNTLSFSECNDLDKSKTGKDGDDDISIEGSHSPHSQANDVDHVLQDNEFAPFSMAEVDFKANFSDEQLTTKAENDDFGTFIEVNDLPDSKADLDIKCSSDVDFDGLRKNDDFGSFTNVATKSIDPDSFSDNENIKSDAHLSDGEEFDDFAEFQSEPSADVETNECKKGNIQISETICENVVTSDISIEKKSDKHDDDDFGDFDTYDPTTVTTNINVTTSSKSCTVNDLLLSNDTDIIDILKTAVAAIYLEDIGSEQTEDSCELLSSLGGSWKHLKEYETKQSYLFPWNNSSSQKTLLKSLGIDSRNILFGPKWNSNMPRFAANLGVTPLQPVKQTFPASSSEYQSEDKSGNSADAENSDSYMQHKVGDWQGGDNFSMGDNQASSYAESLLLDLEHLMATLDQMTSGQSPHFKISDLFTNACNEREDESISKSHTKANESGSKFEKHQPPSILNIGRKINLPDTHIFTPTDSETPWSHTIHYEDTSANFVPSVPCNIDESFQLPTDEVQSSHNDDFDDFQSHNVQQYSQQDNTIHAVPQLTEPSNDNLQTFPVSMLENRESKIISDGPSANEFDDFGDFHSATTVKAVVHHTEILPPTSVLQPVRVTPSVSVPVVNWPEPGDVDTTAFHQLSDLPITQSTLPSWVENQEQPSWISENKAKPERFENKDLQIPPFVKHKSYSPGPTSFILKETRIDSVATQDIINDSVVNENNNHTTKTDLDDFTDFQSVSPVPISLPNHNVTYNNTPNPLYNTNVISTTHITNNTAESVLSNNVLANDDFDDFQAVQYNPSHTNTTSFISSAPQMPNYFLPSTLGGSFLKSDNSHNFTSPSFQRSEEISNKSTPQQQQQILQPLSLENYSQINWPNPGIDLQDLSRFNPINSIHSYSEPKETKVNNHHNSPDDDGWSDFVSIKSTNQATKYPQHQATFNQNATFYSSNQQNEEDDWSDFVSGTVLPSRSLNEVKTISQNIHSQASNNTPGSFVRNTTQNINNSHHHSTVTNITSLPHLSYASSKVNSKSNFQNL